MRTTTLNWAVLAAAMLLLSGTAAGAFNPQPDPPGRALTNHAVNQTTLPPGPCTQMGTQGHSGGAGTGKVMMMRKAGGDPSRNKQPNLSSAHCLNPQPLPPG